MPGVLSPPYVLYFLSRVSGFWRFGSTDEELAFRRVEDTESGLVCQGDFIRRFFS